MAVLLLFTLILTQAIAQAQHTPHGLSYETPIAFSPAAFQFFHPGVILPHERRHSAHAPAQAPMLLEQAFRGATTGRARADEAVGGGWINNKTLDRRRLAPGGVAGIVVGVAFFVVTVFAGVYVIVKRRQNVRRANGEVKPEELA
ncbi:transmembrane protein [Rhynchospora pubera]|uniref:Transmembrane protein n=1 Tax=Rhynchospora pubera TaxID=906938 RepID=A0AAV8EAU7_9POAL|nr:transmembrane protein [Rhynchospora pubera]